MSQFQTISTISLCLASVLVIISMIMSYRQELKLEKDIFISAIRATVQLLVIGFILSYIFSTESPIFIIGLLGFILGFVIVKCYQILNCVNKRWKLN